MLWFSSYVIVFEFSWKVKERKKIGGITYWLTLVDSFLAHRSFRIKVDKAVSVWKLMVAGVPRGFTLFPMLYNLYTSDINVYADDICIYRKNRSPRFGQLAVQRHINEFGRWASKWRINIRAEKTKDVVFPKRTRLILLYSSFTATKSNMFQAAFIWGLSWIIEWTDSLFDNRRITKPLSYPWISQRRVIVRPRHPILAS